MWDLELALVYVMACFLLVWASETTGELIIYALHVHFCTCSVLSWAEVSYFDTPCPN